MLPVRKAITTLRSFMRLPILGLLLLHAFVGRASHVIGGEMYYDYLGGPNMQYRVTVKLYRDCGPDAQADLPAVLDIGIYDGATNGFIVSRSITATGPPTPIPVVVQSPCLTLPQNACIETRTYSGILTLPHIPNGYQLSYQVCCRTATIVNVIAPGDVGLSLLVRIPPGSIENHSPRFVALPPVGLCLNEPLTFDHSATDPDGDELVYTLCSPFNDFGFLPAIPSVLTQPPYSPIPWQAGFSEGEPIVASPPISIDPSTGVLTLTPTQIGRFVIGICVSEYRDGVLLSTSRRDFMFQVVPCDAVVSGVIGPQLVCTGPTVQFTSTSSGSDVLAWDFGDPNTTLDTSSAANPTWTYSEPGIYTVRLITGPGEQCVDTSYAVFSAHYPPDPLNFAVPDPCSPNPIELVAQGEVGGGAEITWNLGNGATPYLVTGNPISVTFAPGTYSVALSVTENGCTTITSEEFIIQPRPTAYFTVDPTSPVNMGTTAVFSDSSWTDGGSIVSWSWSVNGETTAAGEVWVWEDLPPGDHSIVLTVTTADGCSDSYSMIYSVIPDAIVIPNVFTPNGDGVNDQFIVEHLRYFKHELMIYNRWGQVVHGPLDNAAPWSGQDHPDGTYYYVIRLSASGLEYTGHITLLR
jgi:gliding motility-associated-like protein